jgi:signal transduction histidine kinase/ligand-binding sensor domain-containing protein
MLKNTIHYTRVPLAVTLLLLLLSRCNQFEKTVSFPSGDKGFSDPLSRPLKFSNPVSIQWETVPPDSIRPMETRHFDFNKLPAKPFYIGEPQPLMKPLVEQKFDWNHLPDTAFNYENLPSQKLRFRTTPLGAPRVTTPGPANVLPGVGRGVMDAGSSMGLPGSGKCFLKDKHGQLWIGTTKGISRYDGVTILSYGAEQGLAEFDIASLVEDKDGRIWAGTNRGEIFSLDPGAGLISQLIYSHDQSPSWSMIQDKEGQIWFTLQGFGVFVINTKNETLKQLSKKEGLNQNINIRVFEDAEGLVWISTGDGFSVIDKKAGRLKRVKKESGINIGFGVSIIQDKSGRILLGGQGGVNIIDTKKGSIKLLWKDQGLPDAVNTGLLEDKKGTFWIGNNIGQAFAFDEKKGTLETLKITNAGNAAMYSLIEDQNGQVWIGSTAAGSYYLDINNGRPGNFTKADGLGNNSIWSIKEDRNGYYWIGTREGIDVYDPATKTIKHIGKEQGLLNDVNTKLELDNLGRIWSGGNNAGICIIDIRKGTIQYLGREQGLEGTTWGALALDKQGMMWIASNDGKLQAVNPGEKLVKRITNLAESKGKRIDALVEDRQGQIWVGITGGGVSVIDKNSNTIKNINTSRRLINNDITSFLEDAKNNIWIGTQRGIDVANLEDSTLTSFTTSEGLENNEIWALNEYGQNIYVGNTMGFTILTPTDSQHKVSRTWHARSYGKAQGLTFIDVAENGSFITKSGQLWAGVDNQTLFIMDPPITDSSVPPAYVTGISIFDMPQSFIDRRSFESAIKKIDTLWKTETDSFYHDKKLPADTGYLAKNGIEWEGIEGPYKMPVNLHLPYHQNFLSFTYTGSYTSNPDRVKYRYILEGIDRTWSPISSRSASENYRDLPPGDYTFKVSSIGMNGHWSTPASFRFTITPPWWQSWWAYLFYIILAGGAVYGIAQYRSRWLKKENRILEEKVSHRTAQLKKTIDELQTTQSQLVQSEKMASLGELTAGIAHEIQNPLNFVNNFSEVNTELVEELQQELKAGKIEDAIAISNDIKENQYKINHHGKRADAIVKGMLQHSRNSTGQKEPADINALCDEYFRLAYHGLRAKDKSFNAIMKTDFDDSIGNIEIIPQDMGRVILNLINNAFYAVEEKASLSYLSMENSRKTLIMPDHYEPTVTVTTKKKGEHVLISVKDNGNGIPQKVLDKIFHPFFTTKPTGEGTGLGLSLSYDIVKAHGGEIKVETKEGEGTEFVIHLPG